MGIEARTWWSDQFNTFQSLTRDCCMRLHFRMLSVAENHCFESCWEFPASRQTSHASSWKPFLKSQERTLIPSTQHRSYCSVSCAGMLLQTYPLVSSVFVTSVHTCDIRKADVQIWPHSSCEASIAPAPKVACMVS